MPRQPVDVTDTELAILEVLWDRDTATIREITDELYPNGTTAEYATVQSLLERLEKKNCVSRDRRTYAHLFAPKIDRSSLLGSRLEELAEKLCGGTWTPLLVHVAEHLKLSAKDRKRLKALIKDLE